MDKFESHLGARRPVRGRGGWWCFAHDFGSLLKTFELSLLRPRSNCKSFGKFLTRLVEPAFPTPENRRNPQQQWQNVTCRIAWFRSTGGSSHCSSNRNPVAEVDGSCCWPWNWLAAADPLSSPPHCWPDLLWLVLLVLLLQLLKRRLQTAEGKWAERIGDVIHRAKVGNRGVD